MNLFVKVSNKELFMRGPIKFKYMDQSGAGRRVVSNAANHFKCSHLKQRTLQESCCNESLCMGFQTPPQVESGCCQASIFRGESFWGKAFSARQAAIFCKRLSHKNDAGVHVVNARKAPLHFTLCVEHRSPCG